MFAIVMNDSKEIVDHPYIMEKVKNTTQTRMFEPMPYVKY
jgi:hypothetical protein